MLVLLSSTVPSITVGEAGSARVLAARGFAPRADALGDSLNIKDSGARCDSTDGIDGTDDTATIQAALDRLTIAQALYVPATGARFCKVTAPLKLPKVNGIAIYGEGRRTSRIVQVTPGADLFDTDNAWATAVNGLSIRDMTLQGLNRARYGLRLVASGRSTISRVRFTGFTGGAGIYARDSLSVTIDDAEFDSNRDGILEDGGAGSGPNGWRLNSSYFGSQARYAVNVYSCYGWTVGGNIMESNAKGGFICTTAGGGVHIAGNYFEENRDGAAGTFDIHLGSASFVRGCSVTDSYFNGRAPTDASDYYPIRLGYVFGCRVANNFVNIGNRFLRLETASSSDSELGPTAYSDAFERNDPTTVYANVPPGFVSARNRVRDPLVVAKDTINLVTSGFASGWTVRVTGSSAWASNSNRAQNRPSFALTRKGGVASIAYTVAIGDGYDNIDARGRYHTFCVDALSTETAADSFTITLDNGTSGSTVPLSQKAPDGWVTSCASYRSGTSDRALRALIEATSDPAVFLFANPRLYRGLEGPQVQ